jgi:hypothetical protein
VDLKELRVNGKRLQQSLEEMAKIGATPGGGVQRLTLSDEERNWTWRLPLMKWEVSSASGPEKAMTWRR